jgi:N-acetylglucosamine kinase-like BadF-type ATPase
VSDLWLAVDGGQSATIALVAAADGTIRGVGRGGPIRHHTEVRADDDARHAIGAAVGEAIAGVRDGDTIVCGCLALTGSDTVAEATVRKLLPGVHTLVLESDALAALATGTLGAGGIGLIAGTGAVAVAQGRRGGPIRRGGWGWLLGDEGSGFWIGLEGLRAAARHVDGTGPQTTLTANLPARLRQIDIHAVAGLLTGQGLERAQVAALTEDVIAIADDGDAVAITILDEAAHRLSSLVLATIQAARFLEPDERVVVGSGGVLRARRVVTSLTQILAEGAAEYRFMVPDIPPVIGAFYLGLRDHGLPIPEGTRTRIVEQGAAWQLGRKVLEGQGRGTGAQAAMQTGSGRP